ncbi:MAG: DUF2804 domain-containing protein [Candidatus Nanopelagicales bacterium]
MPSEKELTEPVDLCRPDGRLNPQAVGWCRSPVITANLTRNSRNKRWEYWAVQQADMVFAMTISDLGYAGLHSAWFLDPAGREHAWQAMTPRPRLQMPEVPGGSAVAVHTRKVSLRIDPSPQGVRLRAMAEDLAADIEVARPPGHESMGVVVPWSDDQFQYTLKETALPARGTVVRGSTTYTFDDAWATWDFGRGRWPRNVVWNWGSGAGTSGDHTIGLQLGGKWTDGTPMTENAIFVDGRSHKIGEVLDWSYEPGAWLSPWKVRTADGSVNLTLRPKYDRNGSVNLGVVSNTTHQCFGTWHGTVDVSGLGRISVDGVHGWAEEVSNRW